LSGPGLLRGRVAALATVIVALLGTGTWVALTHASSQPARAATAPATAAADTSGGAHQALATPLRVLAVTPGANATHVNGGAEVHVVFSTALAADSPLPKIQPAVTGKWRRGTGNSIRFVPAKGFSPQTQVRVRIPAGRHGVRAATGGLLSAPVSVRFRTGTYSTRRLVQLLAQLKYLPLTWTPASPADAAPLTAAAQRRAAYEPPAGSFSWRHGYPAQLKTFWKHGGPGSLIVKGAVMAFEADHGLQLDGIAGPQVWDTAFAAARAGQSDAHGYTYAIASEHSPETLTIWHNGRKVLRTLANTGIPGRTTVPGTFPVYLRYLNTIMKGTNPDGTKYSDHVQFVSYFNGGDAVHYFVRPSYGFPQSLGCVELPLAPAERAWPLLTYGSLVTVTQPG
jgi:hypothetical protein